MEKRAKGALLLALQLTLREKSDYFAVIYN
jgi:hypothetical protein